MRKTRFRIGGMAVCMLLASFAGMPAAMISSPAYAQPGGQTTTTTTTSNIGQQVATAINAGQPTSTITGMIQSVAGNNASVQQITQIVNNLQGGNASPTAVMGLVNGLVGGSLPAPVATAMSALNNLGNITNASQLTSLLTNPSVQSAINSLGSVGQIASTVQNIVNIAQNPAALLNPANLTQIAQTIATAFPSIANALGGLNGIMSALGSVGGLVGAILGGTGGIGGVVQPISDQNPQNASACATPCFCARCAIEIPQHYSEVRAHTQTEFQRHRGWVVNTFWLENVLPALQLMAEQLTAVGVAQIQMIGAMLDAKHQLETQRLFQQMMAQAHKDYQPSEGMCTFGTAVRSLAGSERRSNLVQLAYAQRMNQRQALSGDVVSVESLDSDKRSRVQNFITRYCDQADNANGLGSLCRSPVPDAARRNIDIDYTRNVESRLTLNIDFQPTTGTAETPDEQDLFALSANLFSNNVAPIVAPELLAERGGTSNRIRQSAVEKYMDLRAIFAKRSVAQNSFAAITSQRAAGAPESAPYTKAILRELGISDTNEINQLLGENPSYFAQMEILTKKIYQNPSFYTELYDKPVNVERKGAAMQAIGLMQDRDLYNSLLRSEVVLSVLLETMLQKEQDKVANEGPKRNPAGGAP